MKITLWMPANPGEVFAAGALDRQVGRTVPLRWRAGHGGTVPAELGSAIVTSAVVAADGSGVTLTMETDDGGN